MKPKLFSATNNKNKIIEAENILNIPICQIDVELKEIQAIDVEEVIKEKAIEAYEKTGKLVLVEDTGLYFDSWDGLPGALIKWFLSTVGNEGICKMMETEENRKATAKTSVGLCNGGKPLIFTGVVKGVITQGPRGQHGFGWDPIFQPDGHSKTFAQMPPEEKNIISMRNIAFKHLRAGMVGFVDIPSENAVDHR